MKRSSRLLWIVLLLSMCSCVSFEKFSIEVYKPSELSLPANIRKVALVSRNLKYRNDTLQGYHSHNHRLVKDKIRFNLDSLAIKTCLDSLSGQLLAKNRFDSILILPVTFIPESRVKEIRPATGEWYKSISGKTGADALILLDMFSCFYSIDDDFTEPQANVKTSNIWSVYDFKSQKIIDRFTQIDTLYWSGTNENGDYKKISLPGKKEAIKLASGVIGANYSKHITPAWTVVYRDIMKNGKPEFQKASTLAKKGNWDDASAIWQKYVKSKNKRNRIISFYNLALASEMSGDIGKALEWTGQAAKLSAGLFHADENEAVRKYSTILYRRKFEISKLDGQNEIR